jgi:putative membrane protein
MPSDPAPAWSRPPGRRPELDGTARRTSAVTVAFHAVYGALGVAMLLPEVFLADVTGVPDTGEPEGWNQFLLFGVVLVVTQVYAIASWFVTTYSVGGDRLVVDSGLLTRHRRVLPYGRVQQVDIGQRLLQRLVGYATVKVSTAGESDAASVQLGLFDRPLAEALRAHVLERRDALQAAALGTSLETSTAPTSGPAAPGLAGLPPPAPPAEVLLRVDGGQLLLAALTGPAAAIGLPALVVALPFLVGIGVLSAFGVALVALALFVAQAVSYLLGYHGFTLTRRGDDLHLRSGLTQVRDATVPRRRVQVVTISDNPIWRLLGLVSVELRSAAPPGRRGDADDVSTSSTIPVVDRHDLDRVLARAMGPDWVVPALRPRPDAARRRGVVRRTAVLALALVPLAALAPPWSAVALGFAATGVWWGLEAHRRAGFAEVASSDGGPGMVAVGHGVFVHRIDLVPIARIQSCATAASPLQRRAGLRTIRLDVAGARPHPELYDQDAAEAARWLTELPRRSRPGPSLTKSVNPAAGGGDGANASHPPPTW